MYIEEDDMEDETTLDIMEITGTFSTHGASTIPVLTMQLESAKVIIIMNLAMSQSTLDA